MTAYQRVIAALEAGGRPVRGGSARCPAHDDRNPSLSVSEGREGAVLHCHAGCTTRAVLENLGLSEADLFDQPNGNGAERTIIREHWYTDAAGVRVFQTIRWSAGPQKFSQRRPDGRGGWIWNLRDTPRHLYNLPAVVEAIQANKPIAILEGEKDCDAWMTAGGCVATTNPMGASNWKAEHTAAVAGATVQIVVDADDAGRKRAETLTTELRAAGCRVLSVSEPSQGNDVAEMLAIGLTLETGLKPIDDGIDHALVIEDLAVIAARVDAAPDPGWLARPIWPADAYGVIGAENKAGKTWLIIDLAVAVASGGAWLGRWPVDQAGKVLLFLGEGGERKMLRRVRAVADHYGIADRDSLPIRMCHRVPHLTALDHLAEIAMELEAHKPALVGLDPLYLAARGANGASLYEMGAHLEAVQVLAQRHGAALAVVHHWNQTGSGSSRSRFSGAGPAEWGRVTMSVGVDNKATDGHKTIVTLKAELVGDEIADTEERFVRTVWAEDPDDLRSSMHYSIEAAGGTTALAGAWHGPTECMAALTKFFAERPSVELSKKATAEQCRALGLNYRDRTISEALEQLAVEGQLTVRQGPRNARFFRHLVPMTADEALDF